MTSLYCEGLRTKMVGESTRIYHEIVFHARTTQYSFKKIKKSFKFWSSKSKVSTMAPTDTSGLTVQSTSVKMHQMDGFTLPNKDAWWERLDVSQELHFLRREMTQMGEKFGKVRVLLSGNFQILLCQWAAPRISRLRMCPTRSLKSSSLSKDMLENNEVVGGGA